MSTKTKVIGVLQGVVIALGIYSVFMALMILVMRMGIGTLFDGPPPALSEALPQVVVFLLLTIGAVVGLEWKRRAWNEPKPARLPWLGLMLAGMAVGVIAGHVVWSALGRAALRREIAALEKDGLAPPAIAGNAAIADAENSVVLLEQAAAEIAKAIPAGSDSTKTILDFFDRYSSTGEIGPERESLKALVAANEGALDKVAQAAERKGAYWKLDFTPPVVNMPVPEHGALQTIARLLLVQAIERDAARDTAGAAQSIRVGLAMAESVGESPLLVSQVYRSTIHAILLNSARHIFDTPAELVIAEPLWSPYLDSSKILEKSKEAMRFDLASIPREMASGALPSPADSFPQVGAGYEKIASRPVYYYGMAVVLRDQRPLFESLAAGKPGAPVLPEHAPRFLTTAAIGAARVELARGALGLAKAPGDAAKGVGSDPFSNAPLRAVAASGGTLVFSIGPDRTDDGGARFDKSKNLGDLSWLVRPDAPPATVAKNK